MNKGAKLSDDHHVVRHVPSKKLIRDDDEKVIGFFATAFAPRPKDEGSISVNWIEYYKDEYAKNVNHTIDLMRKTRTISKNSAFGIGNIGNIKRICQEYGSPVRVAFAGNNPNLSHSLIRDLVPEELSLLEILSTDAFELILNSDTP